MTDFIDSVNISNADAIASKIMVIGVGGGGSNAVKYMYNLGIHNVMFMVCNTDVQALMKNPVPLKMQLGRDLTSGLGAGNKPERGKDAALESRDSIKATLEKSDVRMVFITAGMGGGTGTGAAPVIAEVAKELGLLTVAIVTVPFRTEGDRRVRQAIAGIEEIRKNVDSLLIIDNENINKMYGELTFTEAFGKADDILATAAKGIAEIITKEHQFNVDFADVEETMNNSGVALMGFAMMEVGTENVALQLTEKALLSPLLSQNDISGAKNILVNVSWKDTELRMSEVYAIIEHVQAAAGSSASLIWGAGFDDTLDDNCVSVVIVATGFENKASRSDFSSYMDRVHMENILAPGRMLDLVVKPHMVDFTADSVVDKSPAARIDEKRTIVRKIVPIDENMNPIAEVSAPTQSVDADGFSVVDKLADDLQRAHVSLGMEPSSSSGGVSSFVDNRKVYSFDEEERKAEVAPEEEDDELTLQVKTSVENTLKQRGGVLFDDIDFGLNKNSTPAESHVPAPAIKDDRSRRAAASSAVSEDTSDADMLSAEYYENLEAIPAYQRRKMLITSKPENSQKKVITKLSIKDDF